MGCPVAREYGVEVCGVLYCAQGWRELYGVYGVSLVQGVLGHSCMGSTGCPEVGGAVWGLQGTQVQGVWQ